MEMDRVRDQEQAIRLLLMRHTQNVQRSFFDHLKRVFPAPAVMRAIKSWERREEQFSLDDIVPKILAILREPVVVAYPVGEGGEALELIGLAEAAPLCGASHRTMHELYKCHPAFPKPYVEVSMGRLWLASEIVAFSKAYRPDEGWGVRKRRTAEVPQP